jgi:hypothetical protein
MRVTRSVANTMNSLHSRAMPEGAIRALQRGRCAGPLEWTGKAAEQSADAARAAIARMARCDLANPAIAHFGERR